MSRQSVCQWHQLWRDDGVEALVSRGPAGGMPWFCVSRSTSSVAQRRSSIHSSCVP
ncbi:hypothetical protein [Streptomyces sp. NPDC046805]|uniref:hypothetical protein n=1 Tax=Streptomyces sp. NPDC046805 TaxID=3155134 RepID=UPI003410F1AA